MYTCFANSLLYHLVVSAVVEIKTNHNLLKQDHDLLQMNTHCMISISITGFFVEIMPLYVNDVCQQCSIECTLRYILNPILRVVWQACHSNSQKRIRRQCANYLHIEKYQMPIRVYTHARRQVGNKLEVDTREWIKLQSPSFCPCLHCMDMPH